jgi:hypothetical protein
VPPVESRGRAWPLSLALTLGLAVVARVIALGRWPGINGDEAWYGVNAQEFLAGRAAFLHTGVGNPLNPLHSVPLLALLRMLDPSPALLRVPEVMWGLFAVAIAYPLLVKPLGRRSAYFTVMLLALSPAAVAYSRFGWDPSGTPFVSVLAIGLALGDRPVLAVLGLLLAFLVHPTNVFLAPIVGAAWGPHAVERYRRLSPVAQRRAQYAAAVIALVAVAVGWRLLISIAANPQTSLPSAATVVARLFSVAAWGELAIGITGLFSGVTTMTFIGGPLPLPAVIIGNLVAAFALVLPLAIGWRAFRAGTHAVWLLAGIIVSLAIFHAVAGPPALQPGLERYALFVLVPLVIVCATGLDAAADTWPALTTVAFSLTYACFVAMLSGGYFYPLWARGGESVPAFRTGSLEPKLAAYRAIEADSSGAVVVSVIAEDWWLYWPIRYFAGADSRIHVELMPGANQPGGLYPAGAGARPYPRPPDRHYAVVFDGSPAWVSSRSSNRLVFTASDPLQRPILHVFALPSPAQ